MTPKRDLRILAAADMAPKVRRELSRRGFLALGAGGAVTALLAACSTPGGSPATEATGGALEDSLSIYTWGDYDAPEALDAFTSDLGPRIVLDSYGSNEEMIAKLVAARGTSGYDIIVPTGVFIPQLIENDLLLKLNKSLIPNLEHVDPAYLGRVWDPNNDYSICKAWGTTGFVYDKTVITRELKTWGDFLDAAKNEASGRTSVLDDPVEITGIYYWANGIDWDTTDAAHIDAAEEFLLQELAPHLSAFDSYPGGAAIPQATNVLMQAWNGDARLGIINSPDPDRWQWVLGSPATELWMDNWAILSSAPHPEAAHAFLDFILDPEWAVAQIDYIGYHTGAKDVQAMAEEAGLDLLEMVFFTDEQLATMQDGEINEAQERNVEIWSKLKAAAGA